MCYALAMREFQRLPCETGPGRYKQIIVLVLQLFILVGNRTHTYSLYILLFFCHFIHFSLLYFIYCFLSVSSFKLPYTRSCFRWRAARGQAHVAASVCDDL